MTLFMVIQLHIVLNPTVRKLAKVTHNVGEKASMPSLGSVVDWAVDGYQAAALRWVHPPVVPADDELIVRTDSAAVNHVSAVEASSGPVSMESSEESVAIDHGDGDALALMFALVCELTGPVAMALTLAAVSGDVAAQSIGAADASTLRAWLETASIEQQLSAAWVAVEALFYGVCHGVASQASAAPGPQPFAYSRRGGRQLWKRILNDPSQTPAELVSAWHYPAEIRSPSPAALLLEWIMQRIGLGASGVDAPRPANEADGGAKVLKAQKGRRVSLTEAAAALQKPKVRLEYGIPFEELSHGDITHWMSRNLLGKEMHQLNDRDKQELGVLMWELEEKVGRLSAPRGKEGGGTPPAAVGSGASRHGASSGTVGPHATAFAAAERADSAGTSAAVSGVPAAVSEHLAAVKRTPGVDSMCCYTEPVFWRHRPLLYYLFTTFVGRHVYTPVVMQGAGFEHRAQQELTYWFRPARPVEDDDEGGGGLGNGATPSPAKGAVHAAAPRQRLDELGLGGARDDVTAVTAAAAEAAAAAARTAAVKSMGGDVAAVSAAEAAASEGMPNGVHGGARHNAQQGVQQILRIRDGVLSTVEAAVSSAAAVTNEVAAAASTAAAAAASAAASAAKPEAVVFIHGVGFGPAPYAPFMESVAGPETPVIAIELEAASQRLFPHQPPDADRFAELMDAVLDSHNISRAVIMGHSLGSAYATMTATRDGAFGTKKKRISGVVLIDPIACNLHHAKTTREFVYTPIETMKDSFEDFLFKKELWTSIVIARKLSWHEGSMWPDDCVPSVPTLVAVGTSDSIVPSSSVRQSFGSWQARLRGARVITMEGCGHGEWLFDQGHGERLVAAAKDLRHESARIGAASAAARAAAAATAATITGLTGSGLGHSELKWAVEEVTAADAAADAASGASDAAADAEHVGWPVAWMAADLERQYSKRTAELASLVGSAFDEADRDGTLRAFLSLDQVSRAVAERLGMNVEVKAPMEAAMEAAMEATTAQATEAAEAKASEVAAVAAQATTVAVDSDKLDAAGLVGELSEQKAVQRVVQQEVQAAIGTASERLEAAVADLEKQAKAVRSAKSVWPEYLLDGFLAAFDERRKHFFEMGRKDNHEQFEKKKQGR